MLGFILSKMQMLLFAVGIAIVALLFYNFVTTIGLTEEAKTLLISTKKIVSDQITNDVLCSDDFTTLPDALKFGFNNDSFFYDFEFSKPPQLGSGDVKKNVLIMRIVEHRRSVATKKNVIYALSIDADAKFVLVDPGFLLETSGLDKSYNNEENTEILLYPRASSKNAVTASSPNAFVVVKEIQDGAKKIYIIPCSTEKEENNCLQNVLRVGCYKLKLDKLQLGGSPKADDKISSCFNKSTNASDRLEVSKNYTWAHCEILFPEVTGNIP